MTVTVFLSLLPDLGNAACNVLESDEVFNDMLVALVDDLCPVDKNTNFSSQVNLSI